MTSIDYTCLQYTVYKMKTIWLLNQTVKNEPKNSVCLNIFPDFKYNQLSTFFYKNPISDHPQLVFFLQFEIVNTHIGHVLYRFEKSLKVE